MTKHLYIGDGNGRAALNMALSQITSVDTQGLNQEENLEVRCLSAPQGELIYLGKDKDGKEIYWIALGKSKDICKQAWVDFWDLTGDCLINWEIIEYESE